MLGYRHLSLALIYRDGVNTRINLVSIVGIGLIEIIGYRLVICQTSDGEIIVLGIITSRIGNVVPVRIVGIRNNRGQREVTITLISRSDIQAREINVQAIGLSRGVISELGSIGLPAVHTVGGTEQVEITNDLIVGSARSGDVTDFGISIDGSFTFLSNRQGVTRNNLRSCVAMSRAIIVGRSRLSNAIRLGNALDYGAKVAGEGHVNRLTQHCRRTALGSKRQGDRNLFDTHLSHRLVDLDAVNASRNLEGIVLSGATGI